MTERSDGVTDARIQDRKSYRGGVSREPGEGGGCAAMSPERREGVFDAIGRAGDRATAWCRRRAEARSSPRLSKKVKDGYRECGVRSTVRNDVFFMQ
jgi:hypothetical protein